jgi:hypothetical protein
MIGTLIAGSFFTLEDTSDGLGAVAPKSLGGTAEMAG